MKRTIIITALALTVTGGTLFGMSQAFAETTSNRHETLVQKIADKFGLNKADVQAVFDGEKQEHRAQMEANFAAKLDQLVKDGKITDAQKQLIIAKHKELDANRQSFIDSLKDKTPQERKAAMEAHKKAFEDWAKQNGIDPQYLMNGMGKRMHKGFGHKGMEVTVSPVPTQ